MLSTASKFEFRCSHCWQPMYSSTDDVGKSVECKCCQKAVTVPEPTEEQIQRASQIDESEGFEAPVEEGMFAEVSLTPEEVRELAKQRAEQTVANQEDGYVSPATICASPMRRLIAYVIDGVLLVIAFAIGGAAFVVLLAAGAIEINENIRGLTDLPLQGILLFGFFPLGLSIIQWQMIATQGQTVGKKLLRIKIVDDCCNAPGFFQGVLLRNWLRNLLNNIPLFALIDAAFIFRDPPRCIHDEIAGTYVVDA